MRAYKRVTQTCTIRGPPNGVLASTYHSTARFNLYKKARRPFATKSCFVAKVSGSSKIID